MLSCANRACFFPFSLMFFYYKFKMSVLGGIFFYRSAYLCTLNSVYCTIPLGCTEMQAKEKTIKTIINVTSA